MVGYVNVAVTDDARYYWNPAWTDNGFDTGTPTAAAPEWLRGGVPLNFDGIPGTDALIVRFTNADWQRIVIDQAVALVQRGYSGVFLDDTAAYFAGGPSDTPSVLLRATQMAEFVAAIGVAIRQINPNAIVVVNADPYLSTNVTLDARGTAAASAYLATVDAFVLENQSADALDYAASILANETRLILESDGTPAYSFAESWQRGVLYTDPISSYTTFGSTAYPVTESGERIDGGSGPNAIATLGGNDILAGNGGNDTLNGGSGVDTAIVSGNRSSYTVTQTSTGVFQVVGADGTDSLTGIEFLQFDDQTLRLRPGTGVSVNFNTADRSVYQAALNAIRDFDGNALGGNGSWLRIGSADVNGDGDIDQIIVNRALGRFATVGTAPDGLVYFSDHGWAGETRVAGIYIDPFVEAGIVQPGSDGDSQRRFRNDLQIENINRVLGANDYDRDGGQEVFFALTDGTAYLRALMHADGNIRYANYLSQQQVIDYLTANGFGPETYAGWFPNPSSGDASFDAAQDSSARAALAIEGADITALPGAAGGELAFNPLGFAHSPIMNEYLVPEYY